MLSLLNVNSTINTFANTKCAEIYCQSLDHFSIVCTFCELKTFEFTDFLRHFKNVHLENNTFNKTEIGLSEDSYNDDAPEFQEQLQDIEQLTTNCDINYDDGVEAVDNTTEREWKFEEDEYEDFAEEQNTQANVSCDDSEMEEEYLSELKTPSPQRKKAPRPTQYKCTECNKTYKLARFLEHHMKKCHNNNENLEDTISSAVKCMVKCTRCGTECSDERALNTHLRKVHNGYPCDQCDKIYKSKSMMQHHRHKHSGVRGFPCNIDNCVKSFYSSKQLCVHKKMVHSEVRNYVCEMCGYRTKTQSALVIHKRSHTGEKPYACEICDKRFASSSLLREHQPIHSTERPHVCAVCGAAFSRPKALYHHKHLHLDVKKFKCKLCGNAYAQAAGLAGHMRQHKAGQLPVA